MGTVVVVGANRGIGLGFTQQYLEAGYDVVATYRDKSTLGALTNISHERKESLETLKNKYSDKLSLYQLEITDEEAVVRFAKTVERVDLLILNAGIKGYPHSGTRPPDNTSQHLSDCLRVNTQAPDNLIRAFYTRLLEREDSCVACMSSKVGVASDNLGGGYHPYRVSKAALNALIWNWSIQLMLDWKKNRVENLTKAPSGVAICPGHVRTDMGGPNAPLSIEESVSGMRNVISYVRQTKKSNAVYMYNQEVAEQYKVPDGLKEILAAKASLQDGSSSSSAAQ